MAGRDDLRPAHRAGRHDRPATYYEHRAGTLSKRAVRDAQLATEIARGHAANYRVYGARKVWLVLDRERAARAEPIARFPVERLMGDLGPTGAIRGKVTRTTIANFAATGPADLVERRFGPLAPDRLWVADFTYASTWAGWGTSRSSSTPTPGGSSVGDQRPR